MLTYQRRKMAVDIVEMLPNLTRLWVFGYGSILWKTGFKYKSRKIGHIEGYARRFWQGNATHRGTPDSLGRVATLVQSGDPEAKVWGIAYELVGAQMIQSALEHLGMRECTLGGYKHMFVSFSAKKCPICDKCSDCDTCTSPPTTNECSDCDTCTLGAFPALVFTATEDNDLYLGPAPLDDLANQIVHSKGAAGHNVEYVLRLAEFVREHIKDENDDHLFDLEKQIRFLLRKRNICAETLIIKTRSRAVQADSKKLHMLQRNSRRSSAQTSKDCRSYHIDFENLRESVHHKTLVKVSS